MFLKSAISIVTVLFVTSMSSFNFTLKTVFNPKLQTYCDGLDKEFEKIPAERKEQLKELAEFISTTKSEGKPVNLLFVCTSNSRRSHMAQVWAQVAAYYYQIENVSTFSGGTEQTRVNINAINALERAGFEIYSNKQSDNPLWYVKAGEKIRPWAIFSKKYTDSTNPKNSFGAVMVCTEADKGCPIVDGADYRLGLPYDDPKLFDATPQKDAKYDERCRQIASEMFYTMQLASKMIIKK
jgi:hypothetical protein